MRKRRDTQLIELDHRLTITIDRTAEVLDIGRSSVYELLRAGKLKGVKFGRAHRVVVQSVHDLIGGILILPAKAGLDLSALVFPRKGAENDFEEDAGFQMLSKPRP